MTEPISVEPPYGCSTKVSRSQRRIGLVSPGL